MTTTRLRVRQNARRVLRLVAGDTGHGVAHQGHLQVRNSNATTLVPLTLAVVSQNGGEPERGGAAKHSNGDNERKLRSGHSSRCPSDYRLPGTYLDDAKGQWRAELLRRRSSATTLETTTWRSYPGPNG